MEQVLVSTDVDSAVARTVARTIGRRTVRAVAEPRTRSPIFEF